MKNAGLTSKSSLVTFLMGLMSCGWTMMVGPIALTRGYVSFPSFFAVADAPPVLTIYAVAVLSGSRSWNGSMIGGKQQSLDRFRRYMGFWILGAALVGFAFSVFHLLASDESSQTIHIYASAGFLFILLASLWAPKIGVLRRQSERPPDVAPL
jgi:hypothetical protein